MADQNKRDYYGCWASKNASTPEIKKAYRKLAAKYHRSEPWRQDRRGKVQREINGRMRSSDADKKARYDQLQPRPGVGPNFKNRACGLRFGRRRLQRLGISAISSAILRRRRVVVRPQKRPGERDRTSSAEIEINAGAAFGCERESPSPHRNLQHLPQHRRKGELKAPGLYVLPAPAPCTQQNFMGMTMQSISRYPKCGGSAFHHRNPCRLPGQGQVRHTKTIRVGVPAGIDDASPSACATRQCRLEQRPEQRSARDRFRAQAHPIFTRDGANVMCRMPISFTAGRARARHQGCPRSTARCAIRSPRARRPARPSACAARAFLCRLQDARRDQFVVVVETPTKLAGAEGAAQAARILVSDDSQPNARASRQAQGLNPSIKN